MTLELERRRTRSTTTTRAFNIVAEIPGTDRSSRTKS